MKTPIYVLALTTLTIAGLAGAQEPWTPLSAKIRETYEVLDKTGRKISTEVKEGNFYRDTEGSTLEHWLTVNGDEARGGSGKLIDNRNAVEYSINLKTKTAIRLPKQEGEAPLKPDFLAGARASKSGEESIEGIVCYHVPVTLTDTHGHSQQVGTACQAADYGLTLKMELRIISPDGSTHRTLREIYDVKLGDRPDPKLFQLGPDFQILKRD